MSRPVSRYRSYIYAIADADRGTLRHFTIFRRPVQFELDKRRDKQIVRLRIAVRQQMELRRFARHGRDPMQLVPDLRRFRIFLKSIRQHVYALLQSCCLL